MQSKTPLHYWIMTAVSFAWSIYGDYDYVMLKTHNRAYIAQFPPELLQFVDGMPLWAVGCWAVGVWGALLGAVLLALRNRLAGPVFVAAALGYLGGILYQWVTTPAMQGFDAAAAATLAVTYGLLVLFAAYSLYYFRRLGRAAA